MLTNKAAQTKRRTQRATQTSVMNSSGILRQNHVASKTEEEIVKKEAEVTVKLETIECVVCGTGSRDPCDVHCTRTRAAGTALHEFLARFTPPARPAPAPPAPGDKHVCKTCLDLINVLEQAEIDYLKIKETFEALLSKSPLFESIPDGELTDVKSELFKGCIEDDSEDEPLARSKKKHSGKGVKKKKKTSSTGKKQKNFNNSKYDWNCDECDAQGETGGPIALAAHKLTVHTVTEDTIIKTEDNNDDIESERPPSPYNNGLDNGSDIAFGDFEDDDADSTFNPDDFLSEPKKKVKKASFKRPKEWHPCDQCNARYSSLARLEQHRQKHDGSKPPYICEVCGAHYKHKRACDIHIALHKGISDWKCEECNKLFPSKNALQRHNNIHTGKLNYQCDLCGKSFIHTSSFKMHKLSHSGVKPHACEVCGLALMTRSHLKRHARIHSGEKRHECSVCGKRFSERYNLAAHAKSHEAAAAPCEPERKPQPQPPPPRRLFRCHFCTERFERRYMLERHMSVLHGRTLERPPPTPRNTMSKLLKAQAQARQHAPDGECKDEGSSESRAAISAVAPSKLLAQLTSQSPSLIGGSWGGPYAELTYTQP